MKKNTMSEKHEFQFYTKKSILAENISSETLDKIPLFRIAEDFLHIVQRETSLKLTQTGALPVKVVLELYNKRHLLCEFFEMGYGKLSREDDSIEIRSARIVMQIAGLVKKVHGKITLTNTGKKLLEKNDRATIFKKFFSAFTEKFEWSYNDYYPEFRIGQYEWEYSLIMLNKYGDQPLPGEFYAENYSIAFPSFIQHFNESFSSPIMQYHDCYKLRTFERFFCWFGFVKITGVIKRTDTLMKEFIYEKSPIINEVFDLPTEENEFSFSLN